MCRSTTPPRCRHFNRAHLRDLALAPQPSPWPADVELKAIVEGIPSLWLALALAWLFRTDARLTCLTLCRAHILSAQLRRETLAAVEAARAEGASDMLTASLRAARTHSRLQGRVVAIVLLAPREACRSTYVFTPHGKPGYLQPAVLLGTTDGRRFSIMSSRETVRPDLVRHLVCNRRRLGVELEAGQEKAEQTQDQAGDQQRVERASLARGSFVVAFAQTPELDLHAGHQDEQQQADDQQ